MIHTKITLQDNGIRTGGICYAVCLWVTLFFIAVMTGCGSSDDDGDNKSKYDISFAAVKVPDTNVLKRAVSASGNVTINEEDYDIGYETIMRSHDDVGGLSFGRIFDRKGVAVVTEEGQRFTSYDNDFTSLLSVEESLFSLTQFESCPGAIHLTTLSQHSETGYLAPSDAQNIDMSSWGGLWMPSGGSVTPWQTHLGGELSPPDARVYENTEAVEDVDENIMNMLRYFEITDPFDESVTLGEVKLTFNPYKYGYPVEVSVREDGVAQVYKRYAMGRLSVEQAFVMPDKTTVYISDSDYNGGFFMFIADTKEDLSSGTLYAARWVQTDAIEGGMADIEWIDLGNATQATIGDTINKRFNFSDIFDVGRANPDGTCPEEYDSINTGQFGHECLAVRTGMESVASRLETRRYAAMLGATTEFRKTGGMAFDPKKKILYLAVGQVNSGMEDEMVAGREDSSYDDGGWNDIRLPYNCCGCVYGIDLGKSDKIGSKYVAKRIYGVLCGESLSYGESSAYANNKCDVDNIANPASLTFIENSKILIIGEDSETGHENNALWAYHVTDGGLTRIQTVPYGAAVTSAYFYPNIDGFSYITSSIQHPYADPYSEQLAEASDAYGYVGYIGTMPRFK